MKIKPFKLERYFAKHEFSARYLLSSSDCEPVALPELLAFADEECLALWNNLRLAYTETRGHPLLLAEIAKMYSGISKDDLLALAPEEGIFIAMNVLLEEGDHVVSTFPGCQSLYQLAESNNCSVSRWMPGKNLEFNIEDLFALLTGKTKLIVINFPHNPTGGMISRSDLEKIIETAKKRNIFIFSDEMYRLLEYDEKDRLPSVCEIYGNGVSLCGLSKTFGLPGLRIGWLATRNKAIQEKLAAFKDYTTICNSAPGEILAIIALRNREKLLKRSMEILRGNLELIKAFAARHSGWFDWKTPKAGSVAFPEVKFKESAADFCAVLGKETGIMLLPSDVYDYDKKCVRFGFGRKNIPEILRIFEEYIAQKTTVGTGAQDNCNIPLVLPAALESQRRDFEGNFFNAQTRIREFAKRNDWGKYWSCFIDRAEIYNDKRDFDAAVLKIIGGESGTQLPKELSACLEHRVFMAVSPELYAQNYPDGIETDSYEKLISHEIAHRLHVNILKGNEDAMGPVWFYEGFALYAAGQFENPVFSVTIPEMWTIIRRKERGSYKQYTLVMRYILEKVSLRELVKRAGKSDFLEWLHAQLP